MTANIESKNGKIIEENTPQENKFISVVVIIAMQNLCVWQNLEIKIYHFVDNIENAGMIYGGVPFVLYAVVEKYISSSRQGFDYSNNA